MLNIKKWSVLSLILIFALVLVACGGTEPEETTGETTTEETTTEETTTEETTTEGTTEETPMGEGTYYERALAGEFSGTTVVVDGPFADEDEVKFFATLEKFQADTGITVEYIGDKEFETRVAINIDAGNPPDIADFPQPGLLGNFVRDGKVVDVNEFLSPEYLEGQYLQSWLDMATMQGPDGSMSAGVWWRFNGKSLVWYPKEPWDAAGYEIPTTWDELVALQDQIVSDGDSPWCIGIESGTATGWAATDWMEEFMLRTTSLENYDAWVAGTLPFASPEVKNAAERMSEIWFNDDYVYGGTASIVSTNFGDAPAPMFEDPPKCWLHKQGSFITSFFPEGSEANVDYGVFYLPPVDDAYGKPFLVAGDIMAMFNDRPEVRALMEYFTYGESLEAWLAAGGAFSPHKDVNLDWYGIPLERSIAELVAGATSVRFDASDLMPGEVGAGSFWKGMTDYVSGAADLDTALSEIDASWPR